MTAMPVMPNEFREWSIDDLAQLPDDLLGCMSLPFHREVLLPSMLDVGLSRKVDHYPGCPSTASGRHEAALGLAGGS